jgi:hypothetical protein
MQQPKKEKMGIKMMKVEKVSASNLDTNKTAMKTPGPMPHQPNELAAMRSYEQMEEQRWVRGN